MWPFFMLVQVNKLINKIPETGIKCDLIFQNRLPILIWDYFVMSKPHSSGADPDIFDRGVPRVLLKI